MTNKNVAANYGVPKNTLSTLVKNKHKLTTSLEKKGMPSSRKAHAVGAKTKYIKQFSTDLLEKEAKKFQFMGSYLKKKP